MNSNNDNKEKFTENQEGFCDKSKENENEEPESGTADGNDENLIEIISGEIDYPEERMSLADVIKSTFDTDDVVSEDRVVDDADEEVVFVAPERIMNFVDDYLNNAEATQDSENEEFMPAKTVYFSTDASFNASAESVDDTATDLLWVNNDNDEDALGDNSEKRDIQDILNEVFADEDKEPVEDIAEAENVDESEVEEEESVEVLAEENADTVGEAAEAPEIAECFSDWKSIEKTVEASNDGDEFGFGSEKAVEVPEEDDEFGFGSEKAVEVPEEDDEFGFGSEKVVKAPEEDDEFGFGSEKAVEVPEEDDEFGFGSEKVVKAPEEDDEFGFESDEAGEVSEVEDVIENKAAENTADAVEQTEELFSEDDFEFDFSDEDEASDQDDVDLYELAEIETESMQDEFIAEEESSGDSENNEDVSDSEEELPAVFTQGRDALIIKPESEPEENEAESSDSDEESESADELEAEASDGENEDDNASSLTVHRHKDNVLSAKDDDDGEKDVQKKQSFFKRHSIAAWAKRKTAGGWVKFALKCVGVLVLVLSAAAVLYINGLLDLIDYKAADDFEQFYNLSDTDYVSTSDEVYENPVYYNSSTTIEGFDASMIDIPKEDVVNVLLIGTDVRGGTYEDRGNTDSMILLSINTRDKNIKLTSFMRDMYVTIPGRGKNRLNAAYAYGGPQLLFETLKANFDVDVDLYARVNFSNFRKIINKVGGIEIELTEAEARYMNKYAYKYKTDPVEAGLQTLDGAQALSYARCRKIDSDFNRTQRQRKVIVAFVDAIKGCSLTELNDMLNTLMPMIQTNVPKMQIVGLMVDALSYLNTEVETLNVPIKNSWQSAKINKMDVICPNFELNKTAIVAHIYSTYKLDVEDTVYQSFELPVEGRTTTRKTTTTAATTTTTESTTESTESSTSADISQTSTTTKKTYWWENTTTPAPTTTTAPPQTTTTISPTTANQGVVYPNPAA